MKFQSFLLLRYWSKHKGKALSLILSILLFTISTVCMMFSERTEVRRQLHALYDRYGNYSFTIHNVTEQQRQEISDLPLIEKSGTTISCGRIAIGRSSYTCGAFADENGEAMSHYPLLSGEFPEQTGEIAVPEFMLTGKNTNAEIGDTVCFSFTDLDGSQSQQSWTLCGILSNEISRLNLDYSYTAVSGVEGQSVEYASPCVLFSKEEAGAQTHYINLLLAPHDSLYTSDEQSEQWGTETVEPLYSLGNPITLGRQAFIISTMSQQTTGSEVYTVESTDNMKVLRMLFVIMAVISAIALFSGVVSVMPERIRSLRLLKCVGMSNRSLTGIFLLEFFIFWLIGSIAGILIACGVHEILLAIQSVLGEPRSRGYFADWLVTQRTASPFLLPLMLSALISLLVMIYPIMHVAKLQSIQAAQKRFARRTASRRLGGLFSRILGGKTIAMLQCVSLVLVLSASMFGYLYYTDSGKGTSYLTLGQADTETNFYVVDNVNLEENEIDCALTGLRPQTNVGIGIADTSSGISEDAVKTLSGQSKVFAWGVYATDHVVCYDSWKDAPKAISSYRSELNSDWEHYEHFKDLALYRIPLIFLNDTMMEKLCGTPVAHETIVVSKSGTSPYEVGDSIPMITALYDAAQDTVPFDSIKNIPVTVDRSVSITQEQLDTDAFLNAVFGSLDSCAIVMTVSYAEELGFYAPCYTSAQLKFTEDITNEEIEALVKPLLTDTVSYVTLSDLQKEQRILRYSSMAGILVLFLLFFVICFIGYCNTIRMKMNQNIQNLRRLHDIGMSVFEIKRRLIWSVLQIPFWAIGITGGLVWSFQTFMKNRYDTYASLLRQQQEGVGNTEFPDGFFYYAAEEFDKSDALYDITIRMEELKESWMLEYELWLPRPWGAWVLFGSVILILVAVAAILSVHRIRERMEKKEEIL